MKLITQRDAIKQAIAEFRAQWGDGTYSADKRGRQVGRELAALDAETVERAVVDEIIGNASWTRMSCGECGDEDADAIIEVGEEPDYESAAARLCYRCIAKCAALAHNAQAEAEVYDYPREHGAAVPVMLKGVQGELYPCKPDIFAATYDAV